MAVRSVEHKMFSGLVITMPTGSGYYYLRARRNWDDVELRVFECQDGRQYSFRVSKLALYSRENVLIQLAKEAVWRLDAAKPRVLNPENSWTLQAWRDEVYHLV